MGWGEEKTAVRMPCCMEGLGGWVSGWVGRKTYLGVGEPAIVEDLEEDVEDGGMGFLHLCGGGWVGGWVGGTNGWVGG